jgi:N6-adenosine-specific RNA methylase IME4
MFGEKPLRPTFGTGWWVRGCSEPILIAKRGQAKHPKVPHVGLLSERFAHSRKPDSVHELAEQHPGPYLELFARRARKGWDAWGNELPDPQGNTVTPVFYLPSLRRLTINLKR